MRVLDCKEEACANISADAPVITEHLCPGCAAFAEKVGILLEGMGVPFVRDPRVMRGFDYYTGTVFEFISSDIGAQGTVCGGGRYDGLAEELGGPGTPALGFGMGLERLLLALEAKTADAAERCGVYLAPVGTVEACVKLCGALRGLGVKAETDLCARGLKAQMKYADKIGMAYTAVIGGDELANNTVTLKNMQTSETATVQLSADAIAKEIKKC